MAQDPNLIHNPKLCLVGATGVGKSALGTALLRDYNKKESEPFKVFHESKAGTIKTSRKQGRFLHNLDLEFVNKSIASDALKQFVKDRDNNHVQILTVVDTEGLEDNENDPTRVSQVFKSLRDKTNAVIDLSGGISTFTFVINGTNLRLEPFAVLIKKFKAGRKVPDAMFKLMIKNMSVVFTRWACDTKSIKKRDKKGITKAKNVDAIKKLLQKEFPDIVKDDFIIPCFFIDSETLDDEDADDEEKQMVLEEIVRYYQWAANKPCYALHVVEQENNDIAQIEMKNNVIAQTDHEMKNNDYDSSCFSENGAVWVMKETEDVLVQRKVKDIKVNDKVLTRFGFRKVMYVHFDEKERNVVSPVIQVNHERGSISLTPNHLVFIHGNVEPVLACKLKIGDMVEVMNYDHGAHDQDSTRDYSKILTIEHGFDNVRSIITQNGELIVDNVRVSSYAYSQKLHYFTYFLELQKIFPKLPNYVARMIEKFSN